MDNADNGAFDPTKFFTVAEYPHLPPPSWKIEIRASFAGKKIRRFCASEAEGWQVGRDLVRAIREKGVVAATTTERGLTVAKTVEMFLPRIEGKSKSHKEKTKKFLKRLSERFKAMEGISSTDLEAWIATAGESPTSQATAFRYARMFFRWAHRRQFIGRNPMDALDCPKPKPKMKILTPDQMKAFLDDKEAPNWLLATVMLGGFAGLRSEEMFRMEWKDVDARAGEIHVRPGVMKDSGGFDQRIVDFTEPLKRRRSALKGEGKIVPVKPRAFHEARRSLAHRHGFTGWPENSLRHSFATYHLGKSKNPGVTAFQMGHTSPAMVQRVYAVPARRADWRDWWKL